MSRFLALTVLLALASVPLAAKDSGGCEAGKGGFEKKLDGSMLRVAAALASDVNSACHLSVISSKGDEVFQADGRSIRVDLAGKDLNGDGVRDAAFQVDPGPKGSCCATYYVFSFGGIPRLLRRIEHGQFYSLEDRDGDKVYEIWGADLEAFQGFDGFLPSETIVVPTAVMRLEAEKLVDAGPQFQTNYDVLISRLQARLTTDGTQGFLASDGRLAGPGDSGGTKLRETKAVVLGIVWDYLYSGREQDAWTTLSELWPAGDRDRIRTLIAQTRSRGILAQTDATAPVRAEGCGPPLIPPEAMGISLKGVTAPKAVNTPDPTYSPEAEKARLEGTVVLWVIVGADGCAHNIRVQRSLGKGLDERAIEAVRRWRFEPARRNGVPVEVQVNIEVNFRLY
jgi:TonB family protein